MSPRSILASLAAVVAATAAAGPPPPGLVADLGTDRARYAPGDTVHFEVRLRNAGAAALHGAVLALSIRHLADSAGPELARGFDLAAGDSAALSLSWDAPRPDFRGYRASLVVRDSAGRVLDRAATAVDVSSDWSRFPRYGYLAHFGPGLDAAGWVAALNRFHVSGLQFYDFQYRHHRPLAGTVEAPAAEWRDIAGRPTARATVEEFLAAAHRHGMVCLAYDACYGAHEDALSDGSGVRLEWAAWRNATDPRVESTIKSLGPFPVGWSTRRLLFMNLASPQWQDYLFARMRELFAVYPFDGWHIDTWGDRGAFAFDGSPVDYVEGLRPFTDRAREATGRRVVANTVGSRGQEEMAASRADIVYSELWEDHATWASLLEAADAVHAADPARGLVFAAYLHRARAHGMAPGDRAPFRTASVLLADAAMFAAGASHLELGDGGRMLSTEYFPDDLKLEVTPALARALRRSYDFLVAYENWLRDGVSPAPCGLTLPGRAAGAEGAPGTVWTFARRRGADEIVHLINLTAVPSDRWRDDAASCPEAPLLANVRARLADDGTVAWVGWASPDADDGGFHRLPVTRGRDAQGSYLEFVLPGLKHWDMVVAHHGPDGAP
ncbi:MAG: hypothetical protein HZC42_07550 [Candidatus Eisenbacteria bacterium]|nr:hypothetical protein [Candidatus Eisenbacteria bacterium]